MKPIFIVGHPGAGKALLAKTLAEKLGWKFIDADFGLEFRAGRTLLEILDKEGINNFHQFQRDVLNSLLEKENTVVTTDASIVDDEKNRQLLSSKLTVYLQASTSVQLERVSHQSKPFLLEGNVKNFLDQLHQQRDSLYEQIAKLIINSDDSKLEKHVETIIHNLNLNAKEGSPINNPEFVLFHKQSHVPVQLTLQQVMCVKLLAQGKTSKEIGIELNISYRTVEGYFAKSMELLGCASSKELIALYYDKP